MEYCLHLQRKEGKVHSTSVLQRVKLMCSWPLPLMGARASGRQGTKKRTGRPRTTFKIVAHLLKSAELPQTVPLPEEQALSLSLEGQFIFKP